MHSRVAAYVTRYTKFKQLRKKKAIKVLFCLYFSGLYLASACLSCIGWDDEMRLGVNADGKNFVFVSVILLLRRRAFGQEGADEESHASVKDISGK